MAGESPVVTVTSVPAPGVALFERIHVTVPTSPLLTVALKVTCPPTQIEVGVHVLVAQVGSATTVTITTFEMTDEQTPLFTEAR